MLDYIRFKSGAYREPMEQILRDPERNKELRFSAIRYFGRYPDERVRPLLLDFLGEKDPLRWEYAAISASALAAYPGRTWWRASSRPCTAPTGTSGATPPPAWRPTA